MSSDLERLRDLLAKTEKNVKIIEAVNGNFALAVLNEWRYSTWHVLSACLDEEGKKEEQMARAERHLRRSYSLSCALRFSSSSLRHLHTQPTIFGVPNIFTLHCTGV